jgi:hypothetical protein
VYRADAGEAHVERASPPHAELQVRPLARVHPDHDDAAAAPDDVDRRAEGVGVADRIHDDVGAPAVGHLFDGGRRVPRRHVDRDRAHALGQREAVGKPLQREHRSGAARERGLRDEDADGPGADDRHDVVPADLGDRCAVPRGREDVAEEHRGLVVDVVGERQQVDVGGRDADELRLGSGQLAAEQPRAQHPPVVAELRLPVAAEPAAAAGDVERGDHPLARAEPGDGVANALDDPDGLVAGHVTRFERCLAVQEVQVRSADGRQADPDDRVGGVGDGRLPHVAELDASVAGEHDGPHRLGVVTRCRPAARRDTRSAPTSSAGRAGSRRGRNG